jgi:hypothetical protein
MPNPNNEMRNTRGAGVPPMRQTPAGVPPRKTVPSEISKGQMLRAQDDKILRTMPITATQLKKIKGYYGI